MYHDLHKNINVKLYFYKHVKSILDHQVWNCHEARVPIVDNEITPKLLTRNVIDTACSVCDITKDKTFNLTKVTQDISNQGRMHQKSFRKLKAHLHYGLVSINTLGLTALTSQYLINSLRHFIIIIPW